MITENDIKQITEIKKTLTKKLWDEATGSFNWDVDGQIEVLGRIVRNIKKAPESYRYASSEDLKEGLYTAVCNKCGWWGSSKLLEGGGQIADTGDYDDCYCPVCGNIDLDEKDEFENPQRILMIKMLEMFNGEFGFPADSSNIPEWVDEFIELNG